MRASSALVSDSDSAVVGSSKMITRGDCPSTLAISTSWRVASDVSATGVLRVEPLEPDALEHLASQRRRSSAGRVIPRCAGSWPISRFSPTDRSGQQAQLLVDDADARVARLHRRRAAEVAALHLVGAGVALHGAGEDLDQRALAGAVLAGQAVDLAGAQLEVDAARAPGSGRSASTRRSARPRARGRWTGGGPATGLDDAHQDAFSVGGFRSCLTSDEPMFFLSASAAPGSRRPGGTLPVGGHGGLDDALVAEEVRVLHDERVDRPVGQRRVLLRVGVERDDRDAVGRVVVLDRARRAVARRVVGGEDADEVRSRRSARR